MAKLNTFQVTSARFSDAFLVLVPSVNVNAGDKGVYSRKDGGTIEGTLTPMGSGGEGKTLALFRKAHSAKEPTKAELLAENAALKARLGTNA